MLHCCQQLGKLGVNVSCFAPERAHRWTKKIGAFAFNNMAQSMTARMVAMTLAQAANMGNFRACVLGTPMPRHLSKYRDLIQAYVRRLGAQASSSAQTREGTVRAGDLIALRCHSGDVAVARCLMCCGCDDEVALVVSQLTPEGGTRYRASPSGEAGVVPAHTLVALLQYHKEDDSVHVRVPMTLR